MTPISTAPLDTLPGVPVPAGKPPAHPDAAAVNWLLTWLGQVGGVSGEPLPEEADGQAPPEAPVPAEALHQQIQWLTLIPSVSAFQPLYATPAPVPAALQPESEKGKEKKSLPTASLLPPPPAKPAELEAEPEAPKEAAAELPVAVPVPAAVELPKSPLPVPTPELSAVPLESRPQTPPPPLPSSSAPPPPQLLQGPDKGEVIWSAQLVVKPPSAPAIPASKLVSTQDGPASLPPAPHVPGAAPIPDTANANAGGGQSSGRQDAPAPRRDIEVTPAAAGQPVDQAPLLGPEENAQPGAPSTEPRGASPEKAAAPARRESRPPEPSTENAPAPKPLESPVHTSFPTEVHSRIATSRAASPEPAAGVNGVNALDSDAPRPLRPSQIATLHVDVPSAPGSDTAAPLRLIVSQRGEQVNVRLRSWDPAASPLEAGHMQPLLHSLNEKGFSSAAELTEPNLAYLDRSQEKPLAAAESSSAGNDQQTFLGADSRQQQNQERQQQQQAFFLRKQMRNLQSGSFDPGLVLGGNPPSQQGAVR